MTAFNNAVAPALSATFPSMARITQRTTIFVRNATEDDPTVDPLEQDTQFDSVFVQIFIGMFDRMLAEITTLKHTCRPTAPAMSLSTSQSDGARLHADVQLHANCKEAKLGAA